MSDIEAARAAGINHIGYANKPGKLIRLSNAGANAVVTTLAQLTDALLASTTGSASEGKLSLAAFGQSAKTSRSLISVGLDLVGAKADNRTTWPEDFDAAAVGVITAPIAKNPTPDAR